MKHPKNTKKSFANIVLPVLVLSAALSAHAPTEAQESAERNEIRRADLEGSENTEVIMSELTLPPGATVPRHYHHGEEYLYVIQGGTVTTTNGESVSFEPGQTLSFKRGEVHGGFTAAGGGPIKAVTVHIVDKGKPLYVPAE